MRDAIIGKLDAHLRSGIAREADVVYLLVEIGKYLERRHDEGAPFPEAKKFPLLGFYRNWVAHSWIGKTEATGTLPQDLDTALALWVVRGDRERAISMIEAAITMERLRNEVRTFCSSADIDRSLSEDDDAWATYLRLLIAVLADVPLVFSGFRFLRTFRFVEVQEMAPKTTATWHVEADGVQSLTGRVP